MTPPKPVEWAKDNWEELRKTLNFDYVMAKARILLPPSAAKRLDDLDGDSFEVLTLLLKDRDALLARAAFADRMAEALRDVLHHGCPVPGAYDPADGQPIPVPHRANFAEAEEALTAWDAIKGDGE